MEAYDIVGGLSAISAFAAAACVVPAFAEALGGRGRSAAVAASGRARAGAAAWWLRHGVGWARPAARLLLRQRRVGALAGAAAVLLGERCFATTDEALVSVFVAVALAAGCAASLAAASPVCGLAVIACLVAGAAAAVHTAEDRRSAALRDAVPDALRSLGVCFAAGFTLMQTFQQAAREAKGPLRELFAHAAHLLETGAPASEALAVFRARSSVPELSFVAVALDVQHTAGGSLAHILDAAREAVEGELELKRALKVQTAQAKLSARVVSIMPFALIALFSLISSDFLAPFFGSALGLALLGLAVGMQAAGIALVRRMLDVEVGR